MGDMSHMNFFAANEVKLFILKSYQQQLLVDPQPEHDDDCSITIPEVILKPIPIKSTVIGLAFSMKPLSTRYSTSLIL